MYSPGALDVEKESAKWLFCNTLLVYCMTDMQQLPVLFTRLNSDLYTHSPTLCFITRKLRMLYTAQKATGLIQTWKPLA